MFHFGVAYYPEHRTKKEWLRDLELMEHAGINVLRIAEFAWKRLEPTEGRYEFGWLDDFIELAWKRKIAALLCPPMRTVPSWLIEKAPKIRIQTEDGIALEYGSRYSFCINNPILQKRGLLLAEKMAKTFGKNPGVCGWHLDNEYGDEPDCHCPVCKSAWQKWLKDEYGKIASLNKAWGTVFWGTEYNSFAQVPTPRRSKTYHNPGLTQAWRRFVSDSNIEIVRKHAGAVAKHSAKPLTTNFQTWNTRADYFLQSRNLDYCGTNYYPPYGTDNYSYALGLTNCRSYKKQPFHIHELRNGPHLVPGRYNNIPAPGELEKMAVHAIANGADGLYYFAWRGVPFGIEQSHGTLLRHDGSPGKTWCECAKIGKRLKAVGPLVEGLKVPVQIGLLNDFQSTWLLDKKCPEWANPDGMNQALLHRLHHATRRNGLLCDTLDRNDDFFCYNLIIAPVLSAMDETLSRKILSFVSKGGSFVAHPLFAMKDRDACIYPPRIETHLGEALGLSLGEYATDGPENTLEFTWRKRRYSASLFFEILEEKKCRGQVLARYAAGHFKGAPALMKFKFGKGKFLFITSFPDENFHFDFIAALARDCGIKAVLTAPPPDGVEVSERGDGKTRLLFLVNHSPEKKSLKLAGSFEDIWNGGTLKASIPLAPYQARILRRRLQV